MGPGMPSGLEKLWQQITFNLSLDRCRNRTSRTWHGLSLKLLRWTCRKSCTFLPWTPGAELFNLVLEEELEKANKEQGVRSSWIWNLSCSFCPYQGLMTLLDSSWSINILLHLIAAPKLWIFSRWMASWSTTQFLDNDRASMAAPMMITSGTRCPRTRPRGALMWWNAKALVGHDMWEGRWILHCMPFVKSRNYTYYIVVICKMSRNFFQNLGKLFDKLLISLEKCRVYSIQ